MTVIAGRMFIEDHCIRVVRVCQWHCARNVASVKFTQSQSMYCYTGSLRFIITLLFLSAWLPGNRYPTGLSLTKRNRLCWQKGIHPVLMLPVTFSVECTLSMAVCYKWMTFIFPSGYCVTRSFPSSSCVDSSHGIFFQLASSFLWFKKKNYVSKFTLHAVSIYHNDLEFAVFVFVSVLFFSYSVTSGLGVAHFGVTTHLFLSSVYRKSSLLSFSTNSKWCSKENSLPFCRKEERMSFELHGKSFFHWAFHPYNL